MGLFPIQIIRDFKNEKIIFDNNNISGWEIFWKIWLEIISRL